MCVLHHRTHAGSCVEITKRTAVFLFGDFVYIKKKITIDAFLDRKMLLEHTH